MVKIDSVHSIDWKFWEMFWIYKYNNLGYSLTNLTKGGDTYCIKNNKSVLVLNLDGTIYGEYISISDASTAINVSYKFLSRQLNSNKKFCKNKIVMYLKEYNSAIDYTLVKKKIVKITKERRLESWKNNSRKAAIVNSKPIYVYDKNLKEVGIFMGITNAVNSELGLSRSGICKVLYGKREFHNGYILSRVKLNLNT